MYCSSAQLYDDVQLPEQLVKEARTLPDASPVPVPSGLPNSAFGEAVMCTEFMHAHSRMFLAFLPHSEEGALSGSGAGTSRSRRAPAASASASATTPSATSGGSGAGAGTASASATATEEATSDGTGGSTPAATVASALHLSPPPPPIASEYTLQRLRQWLQVDRFLVALVGRDRDSLDVLLAVLDPLVKFILRDHKFKVRLGCCIAIPSIPPPLLACVKLV